jgi:hypothetical protein
MVLPCHFYFIYDVDLNHFHSNRIKFNYLMTNHYLAVEFRPIFVFHHPSFAQELVYSFFDTHSNSALHFT